MIGGGAFTFLSLTVGPLGTGEPGEALGWDSLPLWAWTIYALRASSYMRFLWRQITARRWEEMRTGEHPEESSLRPAELLPFSQEQATRSALFNPHAWPLDAHEELFATWGSSEYMWEGWEEVDSERFQNFLCLTP